jgi:hypothetical protein
MKPTSGNPFGSGPIEDLDAPAYTRGLTLLSEIRRRAADREDASNRSFNRQFRSILASETGGVPSSIGTARAGAMDLGILESQP